MRLRPALLATLSAVALMAMAVGIHAAQQSNTEKRSRSQVPSVRIIPATPPLPLVRPGPVPDLEILFSCDVRGFYQPCG